MPTKKERRQQEIYQLLTEHDKMKTSELAKIMKVSTETLRTDLEELEKNKLIVREHGSARVFRGYVEPHVTLRNMENQEEKQKLAFNAFKLIKNGEVVFIDSASTLSPGLSILKKKEDLTIVTNSLLAANECVALNLNTLFVGGFINPNGISTYGLFATEMIDNIQIDIAFVGTDGFKDSNGFTTVNAHEMSLKRHILNKAKKIVLVCDHTKFEARAPYSWCRFHEIDVLVTSTLNRRQRKMVESIPTIIECELPI